MTARNAVGLAGTLFLIWCAEALGEPKNFQSLLDRSIISSNTPLEEVQAFTERRVPLMPAMKTAAEWAVLAEDLRRKTLSDVVFRGEAAKWRNEKTKVLWLETVEGGPEYRIRKLRYEALPGLWIPALLYEPLQLKGKVPAVLNVNGHEPVGKSVPYKQIRCINQAKRGMLSLNPEWIGMGQLRGTNYAHSRMNQLDLCGSSGIAPFYLAMKRGLDILSEHRNADPERVAVAGLSGGGWQTIFISSLDTRVKLANPVAGYSSFRTRSRFLEDLGDSEQTPCDLGTVVDYTHLTAMLAPHPALLTFNAKDNCCFAAPHALQPLLDAASPIYKLYDQQERLRSHINYDPGDHNFGLDNRQALYRMFGDFFCGGDPNFSSVEIPCDSEVKTNAALEVQLPAENADFNSLARILSEKLPRDRKLPTRKEVAVSWQDTRRKLLAETLRTKKVEATAEQQSVEDGAKFFKFRVGDEWTVPGVEIGGNDAKRTVLLLADGGRRSAAKEIDQLVKDGCRVLAIDVFYFGESKIRSHDYLFALLVAAVGERPLGIQTSQAGAIARWARAHYGQPLEVIGMGPRSSLISLCAAALEPEAVGGLDLRGSFGSLKEVIESNMTVDKTPELFCFGLLERFDVLQLTALAAPRPVRFPQPSERVTRELSPLKSWYALWGKELNLEQKVQESGGGANNRTSL